MNLQERFIRHLKQFPFIQKSQKQLLAVSGGVDSVVLCDLMFHSGYDFIIAHCNFQLREAESERDEQFVKSLGEKYSKQVLVKRFDTEKYATENKVSIQVAARELRYKWFNEIVSSEWSMVNGQWSIVSSELSIVNREKENEPVHPENINIPLSLLPGDKNAPFSTDHSPLTTHTSHLTPHNLQPTTHQLHYILTAHHANDNIETMLMNFFKGTGISGLHGILPLQGKIFRPLLFAKKEELLVYAKEHNLPFVEDSSNLSDKYTRNFFRHQLFPMLKEVYPNVEDNLVNNIERFTEAEELYSRSVNQHKKKLLEIKGNEVHIPVLKLQRTSPLSTIVYEIIKDYSFTSSQVQEVVKLLASETGKYVSSVSHRVIKNRNWLIISPKQTVEADNILIEENDTKVVFGKGALSFEAVENLPGFQITSASNIAGLDYAEITFPLLLRKWKQGDYFYPLGMNKKKKLSKFFIDQKLSKPEKENVWVLEMNKKIIWIVNHRIDERFKIKPSTGKILQISFNKT